ncbi:hypothetical protein EIP91_004646 [Steccherinum ochraceum]|uniref:sterol 3beta-glucosyltransferase n=1 Tax=Steccherinum ochraceum TaxID=92696 RepID=A0A4R0RQX3_9APHY|nr:hypothetical protein EIP91_004646 [Steccherinum ochraceum]
MRLFDYQRNNSSSRNFKCFSRTNSRSSSLNDDTDGPAVEPVSLTQFFADASLYKQALCNPEHSSFYRASENETIQDFTDLVGRHLDSPEQALAGRLTRLSVEDTEWFPDDGEVIVDEPEEYETDRAPLEPVPEKPEDLPIPSTTTPTESLTAEEVVATLIQEHGALAPDGEEKLLLETDAALVQDVVIVGVLHITTHRIAFHASLLDNSKSTNDVIKAGPATVHRRGLHRKRRVWLEVSRDFMCTFPSSQEPDRMRPTRSILLSTIKEVCAEDPFEPRSVRAIFEGHSSEVESDAYLEFDTLESAREWRREIQGAVFMYKRSLLSTLQGADDEADGVRMSIPLQFIENQVISRYMDNLHTVVLSLSPLSASSSDSDDSESTDSDQSIESVEFVAMSLNKCEDGLNILANARKALQEKEKKDGARTERRNRKIIVDYGSLGFPQATESHEEVEEKSREQVVCDAIGIRASSRVWMTQASLHGVAVSSGYFVVTPEWVGFWSRSLARKDQRYRIRISSIQTANAVGTGSNSSVGNKRSSLPSLPNLHITATTYNLVLDIQGNPSLRFSFRSAEGRNDAVAKINEYRALVELASHAGSDVSTLSGTSTPSTPPLSAAQAATTPPADLITTAVRLAGTTDSAGHDSATTSTSSFSASPPVSKQTSSTTSLPTSPTKASRVLAPLSRVVTLTSKKNMNLDLTPAMTLKLPKAVNIPAGTILPMAKSHFVCLTIGSRGDVQPYIALGVGLLKRGHQVTIVTHEEYKSWIEDFGIKHRTAGGDPGMLMKLSVENKMFSPQFFKESVSNYRKWLDQLLVDAWEQCQDAKVLLESPYAMGGVHIAEALNIPYFRVCTMPWTKTTQFPHPFISPPVETSKFNSMSYVLFDNVFWAATSAQINRWRASCLHLPPTDMSHLAQSKIPIIYNFSPSVVPKPLDWNDTAIESGYWLLDNPDGPNWTAPQALVDFMSKARADGKPIVYIGFGSITVPNPRAVTEKIYHAVLKSDVRAIISKGWSARMAKNTEKEKDVETPKECYVIDKIPHDWLFPRIDAALHHGGAGTTSASLRAGIPTLIKPWFGDQYFWASRVHKLGAGMRVSSLRVHDLADALTRATTDRIMKEKAMIVGEKIRSEDGVQTAIRFISIYMPRAVRTPVREATDHHS